jgi:hypothetical protein
MNYFLKKIDFYLKKSQTNALSSQIIDFIFVALNNPFNFWRKANIII